MTIDKTISAGLEGVVVVETRLSDVDGERGRLVIAGRDLEEMAGVVSFESACALLWRGQIPDSQQLSEFRRQLADARSQAFEQWPWLEVALSRVDCGPSRRDRPRAVILLSHLRGGPHGWVVRPRGGATRDGPAHPASFALRR